jgi:hypothetical protein
MLCYKFQILKLFVGRKKIITWITKLACIKYILVKKITWMDKRKQQYVMGIKLEAGYDESLQPSVV